MLAQNPRKAVSPRLLSQADGRDGIQQFYWRKACKDKICFARFASQTLLASNFCLARQKSPKSRLKDADIPQELQRDRLNGDFEFAFANARSRLSDNSDKAGCSPQLWICAFDDWTRRGFAGQIRRNEGCAVVQQFHLSTGGFACKPGLCRVSEAANLQLWVTRRFAKPSPKRDRTIAKAAAVSPLSPHCQSVPRPSRELCRVSEVVNLQLWATPHVSEVFTQTGPSHHEGNGGVSVKPHSLSVLRPGRALVRNFWLLLFPRQK